MIRHGMLGGISPAGVHHFCFYLVMVTRLLHQLADMLESVCRVCMLLCSTPHAEIVSSGIRMLSNDM